MKNLLKIILTLGIFALLIFAGYKYVSTLDYNIELNETPTPDQNEDVTVNPDDEQTGTMKDGEVSYDDAVFSLNYHSFSNNINYVGEDKDTIHPGDNINLSSGYEIEVAGAKTIFSFKNDLSTAVEAQREQVTVIVNGKEYTAYFNSSNGTSVILSIASVVVSETTTFKLEKTEIYAYQLFDDKTVVLKKTYDLSTIVPEWVVEVTPYNYG